MDSKPEPVPVVAPVGLTAALGGAVVSALAFYFGTGLHPIWWLTWLAPLPLLLAAPRLSARATFGISWLAAALGALNLWHYFRHDLESPVLLCVVVVALPSAIFAAAVLFFRRCILKASAFYAALIFPSFWVTYEYLQAITSPHGTALNLAYTQMNFLPILQVASLTGIWGITFCMLLLPASVAALLSGRNRPEQNKWLAATAAMFLIAVLVFGIWRLSMNDQPGRLRIALIASDLRENSLPTKEDDAMRLLREYAAQVDLLSSRQPAIFVLPEKIAVVREWYLAAVDSLFSTAASRAKATVVVGVVRTEAHTAFNEARIYLPEDEAPLTYEKHHMLPPFESEFAVGSSLTTLNQPLGKWGITICKDMDFPPLSRQYARQNTALLLVPAWDFDADGWLHGRMAILRGVESGFSIARAPRHGILTITDDRGRVLAEQNTGSGSFATLVAEIPVIHHSTLYSKWGDWFAWLCIVILLIAYVASRQTQSQTIYER